MDYSRRLDPLDLEAAPDEELPDYEPATAPEYIHGEDETPIYTYYLRQVDRKLQLFVPYGPSASSSYKITARGARFFSKKADMDIWRTSRGDISQDHVAGIWFDPDGPLPWRPRAHFSHLDAQGLSTHAMESKNFSDWTVTIGGITYIWTLEGRPFSLVLKAQASSEVIARFNFSVLGTLATGGAEAGDLTVFRDALSTNRDGIEKIMCGLVVAIAHFKKMGRYYRNDQPNNTPVRATSLTSEHLSSHRASITTYSTI